MHHGKVYTGLESLAVADHDPGMSLSEALTGEVERRGISWREAGRIIGVPYQTLSNWATGKYRPSRPEDMRAIGQFLSVPVKQVRAMRAVENHSTQARLDRLEDELKSVRTELRTILRLLRDTPGSPR